MSKFLALIAAVAMALFIAGPAMAQTTGDGVVVTKSVNTDSINDTTVTTNVTVNKRVGINIGGDLGVEGGLDVQGDVVFKELDVNVQDSEVVTKFFELDDSAHSRWTIAGLNGMNALEQLQNGDLNTAVISQLATPRDQLFDPGSENIMNVGLQYQVGTGNDGYIIQSSSGIPGVLKSVDTNNFAKQVQIGDFNGADIRQNRR